MISMHDEPRVSDKSHYQLREGKGPRPAHKSLVRVFCTHCGKSFRNPNAMHLHVRDSHELDAAGGSRRME